MTTIDFFIDPVCPFAWVTSQWVREVARQRPVDLRFHSMALAILNRDPSDPWETARGTESAWRQVRVAEALAAARGRDTLDGYFREFGYRYHVLHQRGRDEVLRDTLDVLDAGEFYPAADDQAFDEAVYASHRRAMDVVALDDVGTPITHIDGVGTFGPILTEVPRGPEALEIFDAVATLLRRPVFAELKRGRRSDPVPD
ncbi:DsbA family protein [Actinomycetospora endophytica]|uniref:DsbA family protein n=1 Tax=Actinomycetospora endophytica TaxID=2291215 RepID=A0ABS8P1D3_9PSEU|nr:DsbA family protein [Actinomycetospora endophytica]MCD2192048.1 DsbA family protein [Actinomycetospora endophytica]